MKIKQVATLLAFSTVLTMGCSSDNTPGSTPPPPEPVEKKNHISKVLDYHPSVGQLVNKFPKYQPGDTYQSILQKAQKALESQDADGLVTLGGFGGYITVGFEKTIENKDGLRDFRVLGNTFALQTSASTNSSSEGSSEPGIILVAYDRNNNGIPDDNEWYEIAGSEYHKNTSIPFYEITYFKPDQATEEQTGHIDQYVYWEDNQGNQGYKSRNAFHTESYFPLWSTTESLTFKGTLLPSNAIDINNDGSLWIMNSYEYGYADNAPNDHIGSTIDIDWAVDKQGNPVKLPGVDFIRIYSAINQEVGSIGEISTELTGIENLHLNKKIIQSN